MMNRDDRFLEIEQRLRQQAGSLLDRRAPEVPLEPLRAGYVRLHRRRRALRALAWLVPALLLGTAIVVWRQPSGDRRAAERSNPQPITAIESTKPDAPLLAESDRAREDATALPVSVDAGAWAIPIVIIRSDGERASIVPGLLVPAREAPVEVQDLSPVEQRAVRRVLDLEQVDPYEAI